MAGKGDGWVRGSGMHFVNECPRKNSCANVCACVCVIYVRLFLPVDGIWFSHVKV